VENAETIEVLRGIGVDCAQGYGVSMPAPLFGPEAGTPLPVETAYALDSPPERGDP
jgi:EAL domain-containing protein (putative c-di-GMP-specific phosphodiesterase class I)